MHNWKLRKWLPAIAALLTVVPVLQAGVDDFPLTKAIPADVFMAVHARSHDGQAFVNQQWQRVWDALEKSRIDRDFRRLFKAMAEENGVTPEEFDGHWQQMTDLLAGVEWSTLAEREFAFAMKAQFPSVDSVFLMRPPADKVQGDYEGMKGILQTMTELEPNELVFSEDTSGALTVAKLSFANAPFPIGVCVAKYNDVIVAGVGGSLVEQTLALLSGQAGESLASGARFQEAFKRLPPATDEMVFVDIARLMTQMRGFVATAMEMGQSRAPDGERSEYDQQIAALPKKIFDALDMFEYSATVATTNDKKTVADSITVLRDNAKSCALYPALFGNGSVSDPLRYVPADAKDVNVWSGVDFLAAYRTAIDFIGTDVPDGEEGLAGLAAWQEESGINIENDILGWIKGEMMMFKIAGPTEFAPGEFVLMISLRDEAKGREMLDRALASIAPMLEQNNGSISDAEVAGREGFKSFLHPMIAMVGLSRPTLGIAEGQLIVASSPKVIERCFAVAAGDEPNFSSNAHLAKIGMTPGSNVYSFSYTDLSRMGEELGQFFQMIPMIGMFAGQQAMQEPIPRAVIGILGKLGPVVRKLDFFEAEASQSVFEGNTLVSRSILTYQEPPQPAAPAAEEQASTDGF